MKKSLHINAILNVIKQLCAIIFPMITFPYVSRVIGAEYYGKINFGMSIISYISLIAWLGIYSYAIREGARKRDNSEKFRKFINEIFSLNVFSTIIAYVILLMLLFGVDKFSDYTQIILIQSMTVILTTLGVDWINVIMEDYAYITIRYIICQLISFVLLFTFVKSQEDYLIYAMINVSATSFANVFNIFYLNNKLHIYPRIIFSREVFSHLSAVLILFGNSIAQTVYVNSDVTLLGFIKGDIEVGIYSVAVKIYMIVKQLISAILTVAVPRMAYDVANRDKEYINIQLSEIMNILLGIIGPIFVGIICLSDEIILLFSGMEYILAVEPLKILAIALVCSMFVMFFNNIVLLPFREEKLIFYASIFSAVINVILNLLFIPKYGVNAAAFTTVISELIVAIIGVVKARKLVKLNIKKGMVFGGITTLSTYMVCKVIKGILFNEVLIVIISILVSVGFFFIILCIMYKEKLLSSLQNILRKR